MDLNMKSQTIQLECYINPKYSGQRLDSAISDIYSDYSREQLKKWIKSGNVQLDGNTIDKARFKLNGGEHVRINAELIDQSNWTADAIDLDIAYEDDDIIIVNKPIGLVSHPGAGNPNNTLAGALLHYNPDLKKVPRAGLVHRLDKETSGLLVIAKTLAAHQNLVNLMQQRLIKREYMAICEGVMHRPGTVEANIGRNHNIRTKMAVVSDGKPAVTHYAITQKFRAHTLLAIKLETGRTHQIRVHMAHIKHPLLGDKRYGARGVIPKNCSDELQSALKNFNHQALHAYKLTIPGFNGREEVTMSTEPTAGFQSILQLLEKDTVEFS
jgi:23S rRNA pseudouridine1911/1915/1917 synthase